jgi:hypothetical protein
VVKRGKRRLAFQQASSRVRQLGQGLNCSGPQRYRLPG